MITKKNKTVKEIKRKIVPILRRNEVVRASLFGSIVRGESKKGSDIDILIEFKGRKSLLDLARLEIELEKVLKRKVDVLTYNSINPLIKDVILKEKVEIWKKT